MTSTTDTAGHPDVAEISDLAEGLLPPSRSAELRRHLDACELCTEVHASLEEIRGVLGTLPKPSRMPDDVAHRIDAALAAEALLNTAVPDTAALAQDTVTPAQDRETAAQDTAALAQPRVSRETTPSTARPFGHARATGTGPGRKERKRAGRRKAVVLGAAFAAAIGLGAVLVPSLTGHDGPGTTAQERKTTAADTFSAGKLEQQVTDLLAGSQNDRSPRSSVGIQGEPDGNSPRVFQQPVVPECVQKGIGQSDSALAIEEGTYKGKDALLVVLPDTSDGTRVNAYLMDATCQKDPSVGTAEVLLQNSYTRP
ncbi:anti-sigma factor family protein [Streptomyces sp. NPDC002328]|uniref:anti-sigma factor family protein n=1 Tax=Streptomyces sp. NPDC002328 TaxID=3364642 RepID=UPI0036AA8A2A